jgi:mono/diheme cytochrome c family protein
MAKRKPTSRPREPGAAPQARASAARFATTWQAGTRRAWARLRRYSFALIAVGAIGGGAALGVYQGRTQRDVDLGPTDPDQGQRELEQAAGPSEGEQLAGTPARQVFAHACGSCHTLSAAGVKGIAGPDLDSRRLSAAQVERMILNGSVSGAMPARTLQGRDAQRVARYVARMSRASRRASRRAQG